MKTPNEYLKSLKRGIVTEEILSGCVYCYNKRAKNMRDKEREYAEQDRRNRYFYSWWDNAEKCREKKDEYYRKKEELLEYETPVCLHVVKRSRRERVYDYEEEYKNKKHCDVVRENCYKDWQTGETVWFFDHLVDFYEYYEYYSFGGHGFHTPIDVHEYERLLESGVFCSENIGDLETYGEETENLLSVQFADKVRNGLADGTYNYEKTVNI